MIRWARVNGFLWHGHVSDKAARSGRVDVPLRAIEDGCPYKQQRLHMKKGWGAQQSRRTVPFSVLAYFCYCHSPGLRISFSEG